MSDTPERIHVRWGKSGDTRVTYKEERFVPPDNGAEYIRADVSAARIADLTRQLAEALAEVERMWAERDAAREALMNTGIALHVAKREIAGAEAEVARLKTIQGAADVLCKEVTAAAYLGENVTPDEAAVLAFMDALGKHKVLVALAALKGDTP